MANVSPLQPYLLIAYYEWIIDNGWTPQILVDTSLENVDVPSQFSNDGKIVLNISPSAVANFELDHEHISFSARFSGSSLYVYVPLNAVQAIYARENDQGIMFSPNMYGEQPSPHNGDDDPPSSSPEPSKGRAHLKVVK